MVFDPKSIGDQSPVVINDQNIAQVDSYRYLGVHIDSKLTWSVQVENVCTRVQQGLHFLRRLRVFGVTDPDYTSNTKSDDNHGSQATSHTPGCL